MKSLLEYTYEEIDIQRYLYDQEFGKLIFAGNVVRRIEIEDSDFFKRYSIQPLNHVEEILKLIRKEAESEMKIRREAIRNYITQEGLTKYQEDIIQGMNKTAKRVTLWDDEQEASILILRLIAQHDNSALLEFAFDYVDKWEMYNELFGEQNAS